MLVLSRKIDETIVLKDGDEVIEIVVIKIDENRVKLGIKAPQNIPVHRKEIYNLIKDRNEKS